MRASKAVVAKVIATSFVPREVRERTRLAGTPLGYFSHSQNFPTRESVLDLIDFTLQNEVKCDPGLPVDVLIVNNDTKWEEGNRFLQKIDGKALRNGRVRVLNRPNFGRSFGAYNHAFTIFGEEYSYFLFTEDDVLICRDGYASMGVQHFVRSDRCGFVAYLGVSYKSLNLSREDSIAAHGGVGLTSSDILRAVVRRHGCLPHCRDGASQEYLDIIREGEIAFTNTIYKMGYRLVSLPSNIKLYDFAYDAMRGLDVKRFPSMSARLLHTVKAEMYKRKSVRALHRAYKNAFSK